ncbi:MAG: LytR C-terminal domain-containing protein [Actinomycetota bacterium]
MAQRLEELGFRIATVTVAATPYSETTVFWSRADTREAAVKLAAKFGWVALPKPDNLSGEVSIHVVVGEDET